jgi:outer membrane receptor protein involved in Fe transport
MSSFGESRQNGTPLQTNNTRISSINLGGDWAHASAGFFSLRVYGSDEVFNQNFSAITADRNSESLTNMQRSPSQQVGVAAQWRRGFARKHTVTGGIEGREVRGHSAESTFNSSIPTAYVDAGGRQRTLGFFGQDAFQFRRNWLLIFGGRVDTWSNSHGFSNRTPVGGITRTANIFPERTETAFSPRISLLHTFKNNIAFSASMYRAFRAPTLNELYRNFRVGNVVTNANPALRAERLTGGEAGLSLQEWDARLTLRGTLFWSRITNPIANVTLSTSPAVISRERQNLGVTRARGFEFSAQALLPGDLRLSGGYVLTDSTIVSFPANTDLKGLQIPQVPRHQANIQLSYIRRDWTAGLQGRFVGKQFDDDRNTLPLAGFFALDAEVSRRVVPHATLFAAVQNLTGVRYATGRTPVLTLGPPVLCRLGLRFGYP